MTLYLALDTATDLGSVAVGAPGRAVSEVVCGDRRHAAVLVPAVNEALRLAGADSRDLTGVVVADGPGSFTGLRIAFATAKGLLRANEQLVLETAPSLLAAAWTAHHFIAGCIAALYDALRGEVFAAVYDWPAGGVQSVVEPLLCTPAELVERCPITPAVAVGDGAVVHEEEVRRWTGRGAIGPPSGAPRASALLELLEVAGATVPVADPTELEPTYGRPAEAQARWEREHGRPLPSPTGQQS